MFKIKLTETQVQSLKKIPLDFEIFTLENVPVRDTFGKGKFKEALVRVGTVLGAKVDCNFLKFELKLEDEKESTNFFWLQGRGMEFHLEIEPFVKIGQKPQIQVILRS